jgi:hypothetical protein
MKKTPYSLRFSEAEARKLQAYCDTHGFAVPEENTELKAFLMELLQAKVAPPEAVDPRSYDEYRQLDALYQERDANLSLTLDECEVLKREVDKLSTQLSEQKYRADTISADIDQALVLRPTPEVRHLIEATCERLSDIYEQHYPNGVTPQLLLLDMFIRYTRDQWSEWFYPFVLSDDEVRDILTPNTDSDAPDA